MLCIFLVSECSGNRFKDAGMIDSFTFGMFGYDDISCQKKYDPTWLKPYQSGVYPSRICTRYKYYTCHINNYCNGDKQCEEDAAQYWTPIWQGTENDLAKRVEFTKEKCDKEQQRNSVE